MPVFELRLADPLGLPKIFPCARPHSNIQFNHTHYDQCRPLARIFSQCRSLGFQTLIIEKIGSVGISKDDDEELNKNITDFSSPELHRLSFFRDPVSEHNEIVNISTNSFLGYAILKRFKINNKFTKWKVFESILRGSGHSNNYIHAAKLFEVAINRSKFKVRGFLYSQQNGVTNSCAHVAIRSVLSALLPDHEISYKTINDYLADKGIPHQIIDGKSNGLNMEQIRSVIESFGFSSYEGLYNYAHGKGPSLPANAERFLYGKGPNFPFQRILYGSIESGLPALLAYSFQEDNGETDGHVIPVFGHTFNQDMWGPNADMSYFKIEKDRRYVPSESWVSSYVGHDDNFGSNFCIPRRYPSEEDVQRIHVLGILPSDCKCNPIQAEAVAIEYLYRIAPHIVVKNKEHSLWSQKLKETDKSWIVLRPILLDATQYIQHLKDIQGWKSECIEKRIITILENRMKGKFWMVEVSYPELFPANRRKLGEILLRADVPPALPPNYQSFFLARLPERLYGYVLKSEKMEITSYLSGIDDHVPVFSWDKNLDVQELRGIDS